MVFLLNMSKILALFSVIFLAGVVMGFFITGGNGWWPLFACSLGLIIGMWVTGFYVICCYKPKDG